MSFLNKQKEPTEPTLKVGEGLKRKLTEKTQKPAVDKNELADVSREQGYDRSMSTDVITQPQSPPIGRPRINEPMVYWRIYLKPELRATLETLRQNEGHRRLNDLLEQMLEAYMEQTAKAGKDGE